MENRWSDDEVSALLSIFSEDQIQRDFESSVRNDRIYSQISEKMLELNYHKTAKQVREKLKKLKQEYRKLKDHNSKSGSNRRTNKWYDRLDALLGHKPTGHVNAQTADSAVGLLESILSETSLEMLEDNTFQLENDFPEDDTSPEPEVTCAQPSSSTAAEEPTFTPASFSSPRCSDTPARRGKRKRTGDDVAEALRDVEASSQQFLASRFQSRDALMREALQQRREEVAERREDRREELEESRRLQSEYQAGFLSIFSRMVDIFGARYAS